MDKQQFNLLSDKIDFLSRVLILNLIRDLNFQEKVIQLRDLGLKEIEIVKMLNSLRDKIHHVLRSKKN